MIKGAGVINFMQQNNSNKATMISTGISTDERLPKPVWRQLFRTTEGRILLLGIAVALDGMIAMAGRLLVAADLGNDRRDELHQPCLWQGRVHVHRLCRRLRPRHRGIGEYVGGDRDGGERNTGDTLAEPDLCCG